MAHIQPAFVRPVLTLGMRYLEEFEFQSTRRESTPAQFSQYRLAATFFMYLGGRRTDGIISS
jgi:hypothetical protein